MDKKILIGAIAALIIIAGTYVLFFQPSSLVTPTKDIESTKDNQIEEVNKILALNGYSSVFSENLNLLLKEDKTKIEKIESELNNYEKTNRVNDKTKKYLKVYLTYLTYLKDRSDFFKLLNEIENIPAYDYCQNIEKLTQADEKSKLYDSGFLSLIDSVNSFNEKYSYIGMNVSGDSLKANFTPTKTLNEEVSFLAKACLNADLNAGEDLQ